MWYLIGYCYEFCPLLKFFITRQREDVIHNDVEGNSTADTVTELVDVHGNKMENLWSSEDNAVEEPFDPKLDHLRVSAQYSGQKELMIVTVIEATGEMDLGQCKEAQVRIALLSDKTVRRKTEFTTGPIFKYAQTFAFKVGKDKLPDVVVRFRVYRKRMPQRNQMVGECFLKGKNVNAQALHLLKLRPSITSSKTMLQMFQRDDVIARTLTDEVTSKFDTSSLRNRTLDTFKNRPSILKKITAAHGSEVLISLAYSENHKTFQVGIQKTSVLDRMNDDTGKCGEFFFQIVVQSEGVVLCRHRSKFINKTNECDVDEFVAVPVSLKELHDVTVIIGLFCMSTFLKRRSLLGWIRMGADEIESADAAEHWMQMVQDIGRSVERWHNLRRPQNMTI